MTIFLQQNQQLGRLIEHHPPSIFIEPSFIGRIGLSLFLLVPIIFIIGIILIVIGVILNNIDNKKSLKNGEYIDDKIEINRRGKNHKDWFIFISYFWFIINISFYLL